jgi:hypothetical protein
MKRIIGLFCCVAAMSVAAVCFAQQPTPPAPTQLLDRLAGDWVLKGVLGGKETTHDAEAAWVLNREYLRLHEVSRVKKANGDRRMRQLCSSVGTRKRRNIRTESATPTLMKRRTRELKP